MMKAVECLAILTLAAVFGTAETAFAGAPGSGGRAADIDFVCIGGSADGSSCSNDAECPYGSCEVERGETRKQPFQMTATIIMDDDTGEFRGDQEEKDIHTVTVLLEFIALGRRRLLAQTYMNVKGASAAALIENMKQGVEIADLPDSDRRLDEALGIAAVRDDGILDDFLFQRADRQMENKLRRYFRTDGDFVVTKVRRIRGSANHVAGGLASIIQARLDVVITPATE